jgi:Ca-activated chloride channel family protein
MQGTDQSRLATVIFLTDGLPTTDEQRIGSILQNVAAAAPSGVRLFVFGVGDDVNTVLLNGLAVQNHGDVQYVRTGADVEAPVSALYARISAPQLTDLQLDFGDAAVYDVYPQPLPDLFAGQTLFVTGRYQASDTAKVPLVSVRLTGMTRDGQQQYAFDNLQLADSDRQASYLPKLWASRKIGSLLLEIQVNGPAISQEQIATVRDLGLRFGIVTPYTSSFVPQPAAAAPTATGVRGPAAQAPPPPTTGAAGVSAAATAAALAAATPAPPPPPPATRAPTVAPTRAPSAAGTSVPTNTPQVQTVGDKSFVLHNGVWVDTTYQAGTETVKIPFASDEYFQLLADMPGLAPYLAIGERVIVVFDGTAYEITAAEEPADRGLTDVWALPHMEGQPHGYLYVLGSCPCTSSLPAISAPPEQANVLRRRAAHWPTAAYWAAGLLMPRLFTWL